MNEFCFIITLICCIHVIVGIACRYFCFCNGEASVVLIVASVIQTFHLTPYAVARSLASQQMGEDEQGSFVCCIAMRDTH